MEEILETKAATGPVACPITLPLSDRMYVFSRLPQRTFRGLPGLLADSSPDRFGDVLIDARGWQRRGVRPEVSMQPSTPYPRGSLLSTSRPKRVESVSWNFDTFGETFGVDLPFSCTSVKVVLYR
jgi:hypothetical protein